MCVEVVEEESRIPHKPFVALTTEENTLIRLKSKDSVKTDLK